MSGIVDTNILLYGVNRRSPEHDRAQEFLLHAGRSAGPWYLTEGIIYEFLRVATHPRVFNQPLSPSQALSFIAPFWAAPSFIILTAQEAHWKLLRNAVEGMAHPSGNLFYDIRTVVLMREHGIRTIYTADTDFLQFKHIHVINPVA